MTLSVITGNVYRGNPTTHRLVQELRDRADVFGWQEASDLPKLPGYERHKLPRGWGREATEVVIDWRTKSVDCHGVGGYQETRDLGTKFSPDRWTVWARFARKNRPRERYSVLVTHMNAWRAEPIEFREESAAEWAKHLRSVVGVAEWHRRQGWPPVILADWNVPDMGKRLPEPWRFKGHHVDGAAFLPALEVAGHPRIIQLPGSDHRGHRVNLRRAA